MNKEIEWINKWLGGWPSESSGIKPRPEISIWKVTPECDVWGYWPEGRKAFSSPPQSTLPLIITDNGNYLGDPKTILPWLRACEKDPSRFNVGDYRKTFCRETKQC